MSETAVKNALELLKQTPKVFAAVALAGISVLFGPQWLIDGLGLSEFLSIYRGYVGAVTLLFSALLVAHALSFVYGWVLKKWNQSIILSGLTPEEKKIIRTYIEENENSLQFEIADGVANGLVAKGILYRPSFVGAHMHKFYYNMQPWARRHFSKKRKLKQLRKS